METIIPNLQALKEYAHSVVADLTTRPTSGACVVALSGELGAGKTAFTKLLAEVLRVDESVPSPTFVLVKFYDIAGHPRFKRLVHADMYRVDSTDELRPLGWLGLLADPTNLIVVEWPERIKGFIPADAMHLHFAVVDETTRSIRA